MSTADMTRKQFHVQLSMIVIISVPQIERVMALDYQWELLEKATSITNIQSSFYSIHCHLPNQSIHKEWKTLGGAWRQAFWVLKNTLVS
jgi:hypothetical protein